MPITDMCHSWRAWVISIRRFFGPIEMTSLWRPLIPSMLEAITDGRICTSGMFWIVRFLDVGKTPRLISQIRSHSLILIFQTETVVWSFREKTEEQSKKFVQCNLLLLFSFSLFILFHPTEFITCKTWPNKMPDLTNAPSHIVVSSSVLSHWKATSWADRMLDKPAS